MSDTAKARTLRDYVLKIGGFTVSFGDESEPIVIDDPGHLDVGDVVRTVDPQTLCLEPLNAFEAAATLEGGDYLARVLDPAPRSTP